MGRFLARDYEMWDQETELTEESFRRGDLKEGVSGCTKIDTTFENTDRVQVQKPRSDLRPRNAIGIGRAPGNYKGDRSQYHGEWDDNGKPDGGPDRLA